MPKKPIPETFADRLRRLRAKAGLSQTELAEASGIPKGTLLDWEQGRNLDPRWSAVCKLADAMGLKTEAFR